jgi:hypothetical protein
MTYQAAVLKIEQARAEQWEELDLSGMCMIAVEPIIATHGLAVRLHKRLLHHRTPGNFVPPLF